MFLFTINYAFAQGPISIVWDFAFPCKDSGASDQGLPVTFTVTDPSLDSNNVLDTINVKVNSTSDPNGITLTLTESGPNTGQFTNTNLIFTDGVQMYQVGSTELVGFQLTAQPTDPTIPDTFISGPLAFDGIWAISSSDLVGTYLNVTETDNDTQIFTSKLKLTSGSSVNGSALHVQPGDIVSIIRLDFSFEHSNELIIPNSDPALGAIPAQDGDTLSVTYNGVRADTTFTGFCGGPGGGGGGLIQPGLVLELLAAIGGSPYIVSPPSFGGGYYHYSDGLTLTQGDTITTLETSQYNQEIPTQVMISGKQVNMTFKTFESYNPEGVIHMGLYIIPRGEDMLTSNSLASIVWEKGKTVEVNDPNHILYNATTSSSSDGKFQYTQFSFIPTKSYDKMSFLARAWNDHLYSTDIRVHDDIVAHPAAKTLPTGIIKYDNFNDLQATLEKDGFYKPQIMSHIHTTTDVFKSTEGGHVYWLYDTINHTVTLVIADKDDKEISSYQASLQPYEPEKKGDYKFMHFTVKQLNRWNEDQMQRTMGLEATKAMFSALEKGLMPYRNW